MSDMKWSKQKLHSWLYGTKYVMRSNKWTIWAGREKGKLYYDCYRGHVYLQRVGEAEQARKVCENDRIKQDADTKKVEG